MNNISYEEIKKVLEKRLNEKRYFHSLCVADEAKRLAEKYGGDSEKCYLAGLIHDVTKNAPEDEHLKILETFGIMLNVIERNAKKLWHAMSGEAYIKYVLSITGRTFGMTAFSTVYIGRRSLPMFLCSKH